MLELLAAVCLVRGGHDIILSAFDNFQEVRRALEVQAPASLYQPFILISETLTREPEAEMSAEKLREE